MSAYGQVYWCAGGSASHENARWRGILVDDSHAEIWVGQHLPSPKEAFDEMKKSAPRHKVADLRPWSGSMK